MNNSVMLNLLPKSNKYLWLIFLFFDPTKCSEEGGEREENIKI
jgi:hypothetical protein